MTFRFANLIRMTKGGGVLAPTPVITSSSLASIAESETLAITLSADIVGCTFAITGGADAAQFNISGSTLRWVGNGTQNYDSPADADADNVYEVQIKATSPAGRLSAAQSISVTVTDVASNPNFNSVTLYVGYYTRSGHGAVPLAASGLGVLNGLPVTSWTLTRTAGDSTAWPSTVTTGQTPAPSRALTAADNATTATYSITADGVDTGETLTISVTGAGYTVSAKNDIESSTTGLRATSVKSQMGGRSVYFQRGSDDAWANAGFAGTSSGSDIAFIRAFNTHTGTITWTSADASNKPAIGRMYIGADMVGHRFTGLRFEKALTAYPANGLTSTTQSSRQNIELFECDRAANVRDIEIDNNTFGAPDTATDPTQWISAINIAGSYSGSSLANNIHIHDNTFTRVRNGISFGNITGSTFEDFTIAHFSGDAINGGASSFNTITIQDFTISHPYTNSAASGFHPDFVQIGSTNAATSISEVIIRRGVLDTGVGNRMAQGPFFNDTGFSSVYSGNIVQYTSGATYGDGQQRLSGFTANNCEISNILYLGGFSNGITLDYGSGWTIRNNTLIRYSAPNAGTSSAPTIRPVILRDSVTLAAITSTGTIYGNVSFADVDTATGLTETNNVTMTDPGSSLEAQYTYYETLFNDPRNGDWTPISGGALSLGGGKYAGAYNPDGSWADAT